MKIVPGTFLAFVLLSAPAEALAGRHDQSTHTTPKGYHHDGTYHWSGGELLLILIVVVAFLAVKGLKVLCLVIDLMARAVASADHSWLDSFSAAEIATRHDRERQERQGRREKRAEARQLRREERKAFYRARGIEPGLWAWYQALPEAPQAILLGLAFGLPAAAIAIFLLR